MTGDRKKALFLFSLLMSFLTNACSKNHNVKSTSPVTVTENSIDPSCFYLGSVGARQKQYDPTYLFMGAAENLKTPAEGLGANWVVVDQVRERTHDTVITGRAYSCPQLPQDHTGAVVQRLSPGKINH